VTRAGFSIFNDCINKQQGFLCLFNAKAVQDKIYFEREAVIMDSIKDLQAKIDKFNKDRDWDQFHSPANLAKSISIESGELLECFQWNEDKYDKEEVNEELADVINYCFQLATVLHVDVKEIVEAKLEKNAKKYPVEKAKGVSTKYTKL
jgi:NTP pyrophosphatase (non-canonical NTP hydrolase)